MADDSSQQNHLQRLETLFHAALDQPIGARDAFLSDECGDDLALRREVEHLLRRHGDSSNFMDEPAWGRAVSIPDPESLEEAPGDLVIDRYRLIRQLGSGGMGSVWLAERSDSQFDQQVALKIIKRGMDTDDVLRRFRFERQVLANLSHPNIARLMDGGTTEDGRPYLVMEFVDGVPLDTYCEKARLGVKTRMRLFLKVCEAVSYAHQNLVIHRDLKPGNILVTQDGEPKLLDFGISKVLMKDGASQTETAPNKQVFTPRYAGPEQMRGEHVTTAADVYALGVILFELLAGRDPYGIQGRSRAEVERAVLETEPDRPSSVRSDLDAEIDAIVLKALAKDKSRRYPSADALADDVTRYLSCEPVQAHPPGALYPLRKYIRRHRLPFAFVTTVAILVMAFGIIAVIMAIRLDRQTDAAQARFDEVRTLARTMIFDLHDSVAPVRGSLPARQMIVDTGLQYLDTLSKHEDADTNLLRECAEGYFRVAAILGDPNGENLGQTAEAMACCHKGLQIIDRLLATESQNNDIRQSAALGRMRMANILSASGDTVQAIESYQQAISLREQINEAEPDCVDLEPTVEAIHANLATCLAGVDRLYEAEKHFEIVVTIIRNKLQTDHQESRHVRLANMLAALGNVRVRRGKIKEAVEPLQRAIEMLEEFTAADPLGGNTRRSLVVARTAQGRVFAAQGRLEDARAHFEWAIKQHEAMIAADPAEVTARRDLSSVHHFLGKVLDSTGETADALEHLREMMRIRQSLAENDPESKQALRDYAVALDTTGTLLRKLGRLQEALEHHVAAKPIFESLLTADPKNARLRRSVAVCSWYMGQLQRDFARDEEPNKPGHTEQWTAAKASFERSLEIMEGLRDSNLTLESETKVIDMLKGEVASCETALAG